MHLSFFKDDFRAFVDTLMAALRGMKKAYAPTGHPDYRRPPLATIACIAYNYACTAKPAEAYWCF
jgi:hypothetical protein